MHGRDTFVGGRDTTRRRSCPVCDLDRENGGHRAAVESATRSAWTRSQMRMEGLKEERAYQGMRDEDALAQPGHSSLEIIGDAEG